MTLNGHTRIQSEAPTEIGNLTQASGAGGEAISNRPGAVEAVFMIHWCEARWFVMGFVLCVLSRSQTIGAIQLEATLTRLSVRSTIRMTAKGHELVGN